MGKGVIPDEYIGREQAYIKHWILSAYLKRLFVIVGRAIRHTTINYVDCFAGPWEKGTDDYSDTSIGIALKEIASSIEMLRKIPPTRTVNFRILYIEKDDEAFKRLQEFVNQNQHHVNISVECLHGDFSENVMNIKEWTRNYFSFFFIDPKGWKNVVDATTLKPLLEIKNSEFLINLMYDFFNRFIEVKRHHDDMEQLLGESLSFTDSTSPDERENKVIHSYRKSLNNSFKGRSSYIPILRPGKERTLYFLVYFTKHPLGIKIFKEEAEKLELVQRITQNEVKLRKQLDKSTFNDSLFPDDDFYTDNIKNTKITDNRESAKAFLISKMPPFTPIKIDLNTWATMLESSNLFPSDLQLAVKDWLKEGKIENMDADVSRRRKHFIKTHHVSKGERWRILFEQE